jgi:hypothetical protein
MRQRGACMGWPQAHRQLGRRWPLAAARRGLRHGAQVQHLQQAHGRGAVGVQEAEVAQTAQALGLYVLQHQDPQLARRACADYGIAV